MYCGDHEHYEYLNEAFGLFAHVNALQRDMCPSVDQVRGRDHLHDPGSVPCRRGPGSAPGGLVTTGGTGSIAHAMLAYREHAPTGAGHRTPERGQAGDRASCVRQGLPPVRDRARRAPVDPVTTRVDVEWVADHIDDETIASSGRPATTDTARSTRSRRFRISPCERASDCTSTPASAGSSCRSARSSASRSRCSTSGCLG